VFETLQNTQIAQLENMERRLQWHVEETQKTINNSMKDFSDRITSL